MLPFHPYADLFPLIEGGEFAELVADLKANDIRERIVVLDGAILDGRNRYRAALAAGLLDDDDGPDRTKYFVRFVPSVDGDPLAFVISKNLKRRHLDESQRAMVAARLATMRQGERTDLKEPSANLQPIPHPQSRSERTVSQKEAAGVLNVSTRLLSSAKVVQDKATPEVAHAVDQGKLAVSVAEKLIGLPAEEQRRVVEAADPAKAARTEISRHNRDERLDQISRGANGASPVLVARRKYAIIYADPPWQFDVWSRETGLEKCPDRHYPTMTVEEICALPVSDLVAETALLFMWITVPKLNRMEELFRAWGRVLCDDPEYGIIKQPWTYVSNYNWDKVNIGPGRWNRNQHEHLLIARIGNVPAPLPSQRVRSNYTEAREEHSVKPDYFAKLIEIQYPQLAKIELFRRGPARPGWDAWGNESEPGAQRDDTVLTAAPAPQEDDSSASAMSSCSHGDGAAQGTMMDPPPHNSAGWKSPLASDDHLLDVPAFLRRTSDNRIPEKI